MTARPSNEDLRAYAREHLLYDATMLVRSLPVLDTISAKAANDDWVERNSLVEANAMRIRAIYDFLFKERSARSSHRDVFAQDYNPSWSPKPDPQLQKLADQASKSVAHFSLDRLSLGAIRWRHDQAGKGLGDTFGRFLKGVKPGTMDDNTVRKLEELLGELQMRPAPNDHGVGTTGVSTTASVTDTSVFLPPRH